MTESTLSGEPDDIILYVCCAFADDNPRGLYSGWVTHLVDDLVFHLSSKSDRVPSIYLDNVGDRKLADVLADRRQQCFSSSQLFMAICSPAFFNSQHCIRQLNAFIEKSGMHTIFCVVQRKVPDHYLAHFETEHRFYRLDGYPYSFQDIQYRHTLMDLVEQIGGESMPLRRHPQPTQLKGIEFI
jgi:hypothetical protein